MTFKQNFEIILNKYIFILMFLFTIVYAMFMPDWATVWSDYYQILICSSYLTHDFFEVGGIAATFLNVSLHFLLAYFIISYKSNTKLNGLQIACVGFYCGHAFFGSHILNILPPILGVYFYSKFTDQAFKNLASTAIFSNALSPIVSIIWNLFNFSIFGIILGILIGILAGYLSVSLVERTVTFHNGLTLLNYGYTAGIIGTIFYSVLGVFRVTLEPVLILHEDASLYSLSYLSILCFIALGISLFNFSSIKEKYKLLLTESGRSPSDFTSLYGYDTSLFNMGTMALLCILIILLVDFPMNGTTIGAIFSVIAFSAFGVHLFNTIPVFLGVIIGSFIMGSPINSQSVILPLFFSMGLAPISGHYGILSGILAGFLHFSFVSKALLIHGGSILYNNGFSTGFIAVFLSPTLHSIKSKIKIRS